MSTDEAFIERMAGASPQRRTSDETCQAFYLKGGRCPHAVKHVHHDSFGDRWKLCGIHYRTIVRREKHGTPGELVARWREG